MRVWEVASGRCVHVLEGHDGYVLSVCTLDGGGVKLASGSRDKTVRIWSTLTGSCLRSLEGHTSYVLAVCALLDGARSAACLRQRRRARHASAMA